MRQTLSRGVVVMAAATGILCLCGGAALADQQMSSAVGASPSAVSAEDASATACRTAGAPGPASDSACARTPTDRPTAHGSDPDQDHGASDPGAPSPSASHDDSGYGSDDPGYGSAEPSASPSAGYGSDDPGYGSGEPSASPGHGHDHGKPG
ncbi:hypothetical protein ABZ718_21615, partial [Streptomyces longwoodensis]